MPFFSVCDPMCSPVQILFIVTILDLAWSAGGSIIFGEYILKAASQDPGRWTLRFVGFGCVTFALIIHGTALKWGLRLQNLLGILKILVLVVVVGTGFVALSGNMEIEKPRNFENIFEGTTRSPSSFCLALYNVYSIHYVANPYVLI